MAANDYIRLTDAAKEYGLSRTKLSLLVKNGDLKRYEDPRDKRVTFLSRKELEAFLEVRPKEEAAGA
jgi:hypothetical protein